MSTSSPTVLFIGGAGLPGWIWDAARRELGDGYDTRVAARPAGGQRLRDYADAALASVDAERFTIVAHSGGGVVGAEVARLAAGRVAGFLAVSAVVPKPGGSFLSAMPVPNRWILGAVMRIAGTRPPESAIRTTLASALDPATVDRLVAGFTPEPLGYYRDRTGTQPWCERRGYLVTTDDKELPAALQRRFAERLGAARVDEVAAGHLPMLEDPASVARVIAGFCRP
ncbi:MAG: alpha/beta hydrolase [Propioniciclava sp.]|uniref:alpha/beta fold hydrolase n=1 Tax=Propioniciclava sp. TaxID=2038686 RepID=UPI0039E2A4AB